MNKSDLKPFFCKNDRCQKYEKTTKRRLLFKKGKNLLQMMCPSCGKIHEYSLIPGDKVDKNGPIQRLELGPCWLWIGADGAHGYGSYTYAKKHYRPSQFSYQLAYGPIPKGLSVLHQCDTPKCVRPDHLLAGTHRENMADMTAKKRNGYRAKPERLARGQRHGSRTHPERVARGERVGRAKLTSDQVRAIRQCYVPGAGYAMAKRFGVSPTTISEIVRRQSWRHLD